MKTNALSLLALAGALFLMAACASEEANTKQGPAQKPGTDGLTAFVVGSGTTRTTADYDGSGLNFYWTEGDHLWLKNNGTLVQDTKSDIDELLTPNPAMPTAVKRTATAKFYYEGNYYAPTYHVRYTGKGNPVSDKVTIKAQQTQTLPNDASHIGEDGDCGTGTATKSGIEYDFTLDHKAAYLTFMPYNAQGDIKAVYITKIKVTANKPIAGTFDFGDSGINTASPSSPSNTIELTPNSSRAADFTLPATPTADVNAATMVIAPGTYATLTVEYTIDDPKTNNGKTVTKTYNNLTLNAGKNRRVAIDAEITDYSPWFNNFYTWDAQNFMWFNKNNRKYIPDIIENDVDYGNRAYPSGSANYTGYNSAISASYSCKDQPNANEIIYYVMYGDAHWNNSLWAFRGHLYRGGIWLKKKQAIYNELKTKGYNLLTSPDGMKERVYASASDVTGTDYRPLINNLPWRTLSQTPLADTSDYFYLPALGDFHPSDYAIPKYCFMYIGEFGEYWSSSSYAQNWMAYYMLFTKTMVRIADNYRAQGMIVGGFE